MPAESPKVDGYVVGMEAEVVDAQGRVQGRDKVMLHHIVFAKIGVPDYTCGGAAERFFAEGEERLALSLPRGYGYANKATDRWGLLYMLMNHKPQRLNGFIRYTVRYVTGETLTPVKPVWLDVRNCTGPDPGLRRPRRRPEVLDLHDIGRLHDAGERPTRLGRRPPPRRRRPARAAERHLWDESVRVASDLGRPEAETAPARTGADEDVVLPLGRRASRSRRATGSASTRSTTTRHRTHGRWGSCFSSSRRERSAAAARLRRSMSTSAGRPPPPTFSMPLPRKPKGAVSRATSTSSATSGTEPSASRSGAARRSPGASWARSARRHRRRRPSRLLGAVDAERRLQAPLHQGGYLPALLLPAPVEDGAADHRRVDRARATFSPSLARR